MKSVNIAAFLFVYVFLFFGIAYAHSGKTDANGGHKDSKNVSGLGKYHYHHGKEAHLHIDGLCPFEDDTYKTDMSGDKKPDQQ